MTRQASTMLGDAEWDHVNQALSKKGGTLYEFVKDAVIKYADTILETQETPIVQDMVEALLGRKWTLYQLQDYSDRNHLAWLQTRFPTAMARQREEAISRFRLSQRVKR